MTTSKRGGKRPGAGRKKGVINKTTAELKELAGQYTEAAVKTLAEVMNDPDAPAAARITAADRILDRAHGKPRQELEVAHTGKLDPEMIARIKTEFVDRMAAARERQRKVLQARGLLAVETQDENQTEEDEQ